MKITVEVVMGGDRADYSVRTYEFTDAQFASEEDSYHIEGLHHESRITAYFPKSRSVVAIRK